jgi:hypothetical protein
LRDGHFCLGFCQEATEFHSTPLLAQVGNTFPHQGLQWPSSLNLDAFDLAPIIIAQYRKRFQQKVNSLIGMPTPKK